MKAKPFRYHNDPVGTVRGYTVYCLGCKYNHEIPTSREHNPNGPCWEFTGDPDNPTFAPSLLIPEQIYTDPENNLARCHSFIRNGQFQYLSDCTHELVGQTVDMVDVKTNKLTPWDEDSDS